MSKLKYQKNKLKELKTSFLSFDFCHFDLLSFQKRQSGFSLVELLVTVSIFVLIMGIVLVKNSSFNSSIRLTNLAYEVALKIREAQTYGISVREFGVGTGRFTLGYGVYFQKTNPTSFVFFADENRNADYDANTEFIDSLSMVGGNHISLFCVTTASGVESCSEDGSISELVVLFERPKQDAFISTDISSGYQNVEIVISSASGEQTRSVLVDATGQVSVKK